MYLDGLWLKPSRGGEVKTVSIPVAIGVNEQGHRKVPEVMEETREDKASWEAFLRHLKSRGLEGMMLIVPDKCLGLVESVAAFYP